MRPYVVRQAPDRRAAGKPSKLNEFGDSALPVYRFYRLDPRDRLQPAEILDVADDAEAVAMAARSLIAGQGAELWHGGRLVGRFSKLGVYTPA